MPNKDYEHYNKLSKEDLISMIEKRDTEIKNVQKSLKDANKLKKKYYEYNKFHMEEIVRLDKEIGKLKGIRK
tara:strand:- start:380 stop:595 length:216 start_codon:yes stop_codon:yes gene_type:complete